MASIDQLKLADFGVCQNVDLFSDDDTISGEDGTPLYHPPEMFNPNIWKYSGSKLDIWSVAVILFQMITGELPFFKQGIMTDDEHQAIRKGTIDYPPVIRDNILLMDLFNRKFDSFRIFSQ